MRDVATDPLLRAFRERVKEKIRADLARERRHAEELRRDVSARVHEALERCRREKLCGRAWLFGSFAWGEPIDRSDVDLLVECREPAPIAEAVTGACGREVHLLALDEAPATLRDRVLAAGVPL